jgi:hypothetical protein
VLGGKVRVPTLGSAVELSIPKTPRAAGPSASRARVREGESTGDLYVTTRIILPDGTMPSLRH